MKGTVLTSWWRLALVLGVFWASSMFVARWVLGDDSTLDNAILSGIGGLVFGGGMGPWMAAAAKRSRDVDRMVARLERHQRVSARRAAVRGPVPQDELVRSTAVALARHQYAELMRTHRALSVVLALVLGASLVLALEDPYPLWWSGAAISGTVLVVWSRLPRRRRARLELLEHEGDHDPAPDLHA